MAQASTSPRRRLVAVNPTATFETITPAIAAEWLEANEGNRHIRNREVDSYAREIIAGRWLVTGEAIKFDWNGRMLDGQHRLKAVVRANAAIDALVVRNLAPETQTVIDTPVRRTAGDALVWAGLIEHHVTMTAASARIGYAIEAGYLATATKSVHGTISHGEIIEWTRDNPGLLESAAWANTHYKALDGRPASLGYAHYRLHQVATADAEQFFDAILGLSTRGSGDPIFVLISTLRNNPAIARSVGGTLMVYFTAWNAWRDKQKLTGIRTLDAKGRPAALPTPV